MFFLIRDVELNRAGYGAINFEKDAFNIRAIVNDGLLSVVCLDIMFTSQVKGIIHEGCK